MKNGIFFFKFSFNSVRTPSYVCSHLFSSGGVCAVDFFNQPDENLCNLQQLTCF